MLFALCAILALTAAGASNGGGCLTSLAEAVVGPNNAAEGSAPMPFPQKVTIQRTSAFGDRGNVLIQVQLTAKQLSDKSKDGTRSFATLGRGDNTVFLRDDGLGGDATSGDGVFTAIGTVDVAALAARAQHDQEQLAANPGRQAPVFMGRAVVGQARPKAFDFAGFQAGRAVPFEPAVAFVQPEATNSIDNGPSGLRPAVSHLQSLPSAAVVPGTNLFQDRVLMIRDLAVVQDPLRTWDPCTGAGNPNGVWTFNHLMTQMANQAASGIDPAIFVENWLAHWQANQTINGHVVPNRNGPMTALIAAWPKRLDGHIDLRRSPFRLLAIDPRLDLRTSGRGPGRFLDAGEARFIFGHTNGCSPQLFGVIFEYRVPACDCDAVKGLAKRWMDLVNFVPGTADYNERLEKLTQTFTLANSNPLRPNGSAIGQVRTNEISLGFGTTGWELREFQLTQFPFSLLNETTTADQPLDQFENTPVFDNWVTNVSTFLTPGLGFQDPIPLVPLVFAGAPFAGSNPLTGFNPNFFWRVTPALVPALCPGGGNNVTNWARHRASLASCNGCHGRESRTSPPAPFVHVDLAGPLPAQLSLFLTGINNLQDPQTAGLCGGAPLREFDDLARRETDIKKLSEIVCISLSTSDTAMVKSSLQSSGKLPVDLFEGLTSVNQVPISVDDFQRNVVLEVH